MEDGATLIERPSFSNSTKIEGTLFKALGQHHPTVGEYASPIRGFRGMPRFSSREENVAFWLSRWG